MLDRVVRRVRDRTLRWLRKHGLLDARSAEDRSNERMEGGALDAAPTSRSAAARLPRSIAGALPTRTTVRRHHRRDHDR
jgi:hypothetical protein